MSQIARWCLGLGAAVVLGLGIASIGTAGAGEPRAKAAGTLCGSGKFCGWTGTNYTGFKVTVVGPIQQWVAFPAGSRKSGKNKFGQRKVLVGDFGNNVIRCYDPGQQRPSHPAAGKYKIGQVGSSC